MPRRRLTCSSSSQPSPAPCRTRRRLRRADGKVLGTLATLFPGRIDLGLGRAPGTDQHTLRALRRGPDSSEHFPQDVVELRALLGPPQENQFIHAIPGEDTNVPLWILGSSLFGAQLAGMLGLPFAFASHFAPQALMQAVAIYREKSGR